MKAKIIAYLVEHPLACLADVSRDFGILLEDVRKILESDETQP